MANLHPSEHGQHGVPTDSNPMGCGAWWSVLLWYIPFVGCIFAIVSVAAEARMSRGGNPVRRANCVNALNWLLTLLLWTVLTFALNVFIWTFNNLDVVGIVGMLSAAVGIASVICGIVHAISGAAAARRGEVYRAFGAIAFYGP